jgi:hypothetical protein
MRKRYSTTGLTVLVRRLTIFAFVAGAVLTGLLTVGPPAALAAQITVCQSCTAAPGDDPNLITNTGAFNVLLQGSQTLQNPLLIVVASYDGLGTPSIRFSGCADPLACPAATVGTYHLTANTFSPFNSSSGGTVFSHLGLSAGGSLSFGNLSTGDTNNGFAAPTSFSLFAFAVPTELTSTPITIDESGAANGSYIFGYGCKKGTGSSSGCATNGDRGQTVMTNTGLVDTPPAPEASALTLTALVLLAFGAMVVRARRSQLA